MPSVADIPTSTTMSKKRRREESEASVHSDGSQYTQSIYKTADVENQFQSRRTFQLPSKKRPLLDTGIKRQRIEPSLTPHTLLDDTTKDESALFPVISHTDTRERKHSHHETKYTPTAMPSQSVGTKSSSKSKLDLSPCHICHRRPTEKKHLTDYVTCGGCGLKTCFICIRECKGSDATFQHFDTFDGGDAMHIDGHSFSMECKEDGKQEEARRGMVPWEKGQIGTHRGKICSSCCVEKGSEGEVWCLGCLRAGRGS